MKNNSFFPMIEITPSEKQFLNSSHDIFKEKGNSEIDLKKLERYIETRITVKYINKGK